MAAYIPDDFIEVESYSVRGEVLTTFFIQPAFVEGIVPEPINVASIAEAYRFIFRNNCEFGIISWNGIPIRFSYIHDLPLMIEPLLELLEELNAFPLSNTTCAFYTPNIQLSWQFEKTSVDTLRIKQVCTTISGKYEASLNNLGMIFINCDRFMREWKLLLVQLLEAYSRSEVILQSTKGLEQLEQLKKLNDNIKGKGWLYA